MGVQDGKVDGFGSTVSFEVPLPSSEEPTPAPSSEEPTPAPSSEEPTPAPSQAEPTPAPAPTPISTAQLQMRVVTKTSGDEMYWGLDTPKQAHINPRQYGPYGNNKTYVHTLAIETSSNLDSPGDSTNNANTHVLKCMDAFGDGWGEGAYWELVRVSGEGIEVTIAGGAVDGRVEGFGSSVSFVYEG